MNPDAARSRLLDERAATFGLRDNLHQAFTDIVEGARDSNIDDEHDTEGTTVAAERSLVSSLDREAEERLQAIDRAIARVDAGTYGVCLRCGEPISDIRLDARPAAEFCLTCAQSRRR